MSEPKKFRRPAMLAQGVAEDLPGGVDPALTSDLAHSSAEALVARARYQAPDDPDLVKRLIGLVETEGVEAVAMLWAQAPAESLPGALWRVYMLREWVRRDPEVVADRYRQGMARQEVADAVAGAAHPPGPAEMRELANAVLSGVFTGELDVALDRAAAFARIVATGAALDADHLEPTQPAVAGQVTRGASSLTSTADALARAAAKWRAGTLD